MDNVSGLMLASMGRVGQFGVTGDRAERRNSSAGPATATREVLIFDLDGQEYATDVQLVLDVRAYERPAPIAAAPPWVLGILHMHGTSAPLVHLRSWFGARRPERDTPGAVIILRASGYLVAIGVDSVNDVARVPVEPIGEQSIALLPGIAPSLVAGIGRHGSRLVIVLEGGALMQVIATAFGVRGA